ncbi:phenylacetate--CoA ligase family protein [Dechloromonas sp. A34]|uniref:phenylacetate--CoA ligase family protein n=1 Tax=Dechloromonas sp. A34 TaxID=447588 RepID=UPI0022492F19|nr:AMP-binding protein [Dechloromonas sp. A34]
MNIYTSICGSILFPIHERLKSHTSVAVRKRLEAQERWPHEKLEEWRVSQLRIFLQRIGSSVPYYRDLFAQLKFDPSGLRNIADLQSLPLTDKKLMKSAGDRLRSESAGPLMRYNTGGSSGEPLIFYIGKDRKSHDVGAKWRVTRWWGVDIGDPEIVVWGSPIELGAQDRIKQVRDTILRTDLLPAFEMSEAKLDQFVSAITKRRPAMLFGYPSALSLIANHARRRNIRMDNIGIRVAFVTSERLYDEQRTLISEAFGCPVANGYGARDAGFIAHECPHGGMHLQAEDVIIEIVSPSGEVLAPGHPGEIVVTHTATHDFPFLRYRTGDIGTLSDKACACGRTLPLIAEIHGRTTDFVVAADGTIMHGLALIYTVRDLPGVERFKIIQHSLDHVEVQLVAGNPFNSEAEARIVRDYKARLGQQVGITISRVDEIAPEKSGKFRYVVSHVALPGSLQ